MLVVTGPPASGKSTVAAQLAQALGWPLLAKDDIKERLFDVLGSSDREWSRRLSAASYELLFDVTSRCLRAGNSVVLEANFRDAHGTRLRAVLVEHQARCAQVVCTADPAVLELRLRARSADAGRHPGHRDVALIDELPELIAASGQALEVEGPVLRLDTTRGVPAADDAQLLELVERLHRIADAA